MGPKKESTETRERLRQKELKKNPAGFLRDEIDRGMGMGNLSEVAGDMGWKGTGLFILVLFFGYVIYQLVFG
ncbi:DUF6366 family protein [Planococcus halotolerans]|uniref:Phage capsid protein n=1 Tax=Planococcus halotolerans TaxID=2233542 RepID=A0A365L1H0_9BACL|nr:DUF6366 family protein [Planococcus halotolerans]QHJ70933.1 hypothetical protein DNR44_010060 [Planococcus halotolerans]RAZ79310.1 hypothetical protein DP120_06785 [Planococcus halotolerans]